MTYWLMILKDHPYEKDGKYQFKDVNHIETFIGNSGVECKHITHLSCHKLNKVINYKVADIIYVSSAKIVLEKG